MSKIYRNTAINIGNGLRANREEPVGGLREVHKENPYLGRLSVTVCFVWLRWWQIQFPNACCRREIFERCVGDLGTYAFPIKFSKWRRRTLSALALSAAIVLQRPQRQLRGHPRKRMDRVMWSFSGIDRLSRNGMQGSRRFFIYCFSSLINFDDCSGEKFSSDHHKAVLSLDNLCEAGRGEKERIYCVISFHSMI